MDNPRGTIPALPASIHVPAMTDLQHDDLGSLVVHGENDPEVTDAQARRALLFLDPEPSHDVLDRCRLAPASLPLLERGAPFFGVPTILYFFKQFQVFDRDDQSGH